MESWESTFSAAASIPVASAEEARRAETWDAIFSQYVDVWLAQAALAAFTAITASQRLEKTVERRIADGVLGLLDLPCEGVQASSFVDLQEQLFAVQNGSSTGQ